jgi:hypothetical protein
MRDGLAVFPVGAKRDAERNLRHTIRAAVLAKFIGELNGLLRIIQRGAFFAQIYAHPAQPTEDDRIVRIVGSGAQLRQSQHQMAFSFMK